MAAAQIVNMERLLGAARHCRLAGHMRCECSRAWLECSAHPSLPDTSLALVLTAVAQLALPVDGMAAMVVASVRSVAAFLGAIPFFFFLRNAVLCWLPSSLCCLVVVWSQALR